MSMPALRRSRRAAACAAVLACAGLAAASFGTLQLKDVQVALGAAGRLEIGRLATGTSLVGTALAQTLGTVALDDVTLALGETTYRMPRAEFSGVSLSRAELMALFDAGSSETLAPRLERLSAKRVSIPEIRIEQRIGNQRQVTIYRDVVATDIVNGRIASAKSAASTFALARDDQEAAQGGTGTLSLEGIDLAYAVRVYLEKAGPERGPLRTIYQSFSAENLAMSDPNGVEFRAARLSGKDFRARPTAESWSEAMRIFAEAEKQKPALPDDTRVFGVLADLFDSMALGSTEATGIEIRNTKDQDQAVGRIARLAYRGPTAAQGAEARLEGLDVTAANGRARIATIAFTGFSFAPTLGALKALGDKPLTAIDETELRKFMPTIGTMRLSGLDFDLPNEKSTAPQPERIRLTAKEIEITADHPLDGMPTNTRLAVENIAFPIPPNSTEQGLKDLAAMGYSNLDLSLVAAARWNEADKEIVLNEISMRGAEMGSAVLRGVLGNVGKDAFSADRAVSSVALLGATVRSLTLTVENAGLFERLVAHEAQKRKTSPEELRREFGMGAALAVPMLLGNSTATKTLSQAVARFVAKPGRLTISARAKDPAGLSVTEIALSGEPAAVLEKIELTATAE